MGKKQTAGQTPVRVAVKDLPTIRIDELIPYENNAKIHGPDQIEQLRRSLRQFGFVSPVLIDKEHNLIAGHGRVEAARAEGMTEVPYVTVSDLTEAQRRAYIIADNRLTETGEWDAGRLKLEMQELQALEFDTDLTGFAMAEIISLAGDEPESEPEAHEDDYDGSVPEETTVREGDIYQLGRHRLMCGDATSLNDVQMLLGEAQPQMVFTDPPYDMEIRGRGCFASSLKNCKSRIKGIVNFDPYVLRYLPQMGIHSFYIFTSKNGIAKYIEIFKKFNYDILFWGKTNPTPFTHERFLPDVEYLMYFSRKGRIWNNSLKPTSVYKKFYVTSKLQGRTDGGADLHPTMKPMEIVADKVRISSAENGTVLDLFGGSGTTLIACEQLGRTCYMMEIDPKYGQVIIDRWEKMTGEKAVLLNDRARS
jgi:DNA modification methylase